jgi:hypothetical protein
MLKYKNLCIASRKHALHKIVFIGPVAEFKERGSRDYVLATCLMLEE